MTKNYKSRRLNEIKEMIHAFCENHLNEELEGYAIKLCEDLSRKRKISIERGRKDIWAASIIYVIARLNFLFDEENDYYIVADTICDFFKTKKSTVSNKSTEIDKVCKLGLGAEGYCSQHITDMFTFVQTPEGLIFPKSMIEDGELVIEFVEGEEAEELNRFNENQRLIEKQKEQRKKARRAEINRKIAENRKKTKNNRQMNLFDDF